MLIYPYEAHKIHSFGYPSLFLNKHLLVTLIYSVAPASYANVSLTMKICAQKEAGDHQSLACYLRATRVSRSPQCEKCSKRLRRQVPHNYNPPTPPLSQHLALSEQ